MSSIYIFFEYHLMLRFYIFDIYHDQKILLVPLCLQLLLLDPLSPQHRQQLRTPNLRPTARNIPCLHRYNSASKVVSRKFVVHTIFEFFDT